MFKEVSLVNTQPATPERNSFHTALPRHGPATQTISSPSTRAPRPGSQVCVPWAPSMSLVPFQTESYGRVTSQRYVCVFQMTRMFLRSEEVRWDGTSIHCHVSYVWSPVSLISRVTKSLPRSSASPARQVLGRCYDASLTDDGEDIQKGTVTWRDYKLSNELHHVWMAPGSLCFSPTARCPSGLPRSWDDLGGTRGEDIHRLLWHEPNWR